MLSDSCEMNYEAEPLQSYSLKIVLKETLEVLALRMLAIKMRLLL